MRVRQALDALRSTWRAEADTRRQRLSALQRRLMDLPGEARDAPHQWLGHMSPGCTATHGVHEACDFSCTACYLGPEANRTQPLGFDEVCAQLDAIRDYTGPGGNVQITSGEVTLLDAETLGRIVAYARSIGLDPMVMSHGQRFEQDPAYLERLMREAGLQKVGIHIDSSQRGRTGTDRETRESDLMGVRERMGNLVRGVRATTGKPLYAAHTFTVTADNLDEVADVVRWTAHNADAFRMISLQPTADVGRTRTARQTGRIDEVWQRVCEGLGTPVNPHTFTFGHPDCNRVALAFVCRFGDQMRVMEVRREGSAVDDAFLAQLIDGGFRGYSPDGSSPLQSMVKVLQLIAESPRHLWQWPSYILYRLVQDRDWTLRFAAAVLRGEPWSVAPLVVVVHRFMDEGELGTEAGRARLDACAFKVPVDGSMVSMCELNATGLRTELSRRAGRRVRLPTVAA